VTDLELALAAQDCYAERGAAWEQVWDLEGVWVATRQNAAEERMVAFRGSLTVEDWYRDLEVLPTHLRGIGWVHSGFARSMVDVLAELRPTLAERSCWLTGHSLGAARAWILAGLIVAARDIALPLGIVTFGCPRPGFPRLRRVVGRPTMARRTYENAGDPVADVPLRIPFIWPYCDCVTPIGLSVPPAGAPPFGAHHVDLYVQGVRELAEPAKTG